MVKVIIEQDGKRKEFIGDLAIGTVAKFHENETNADTFINGKWNNRKATELLLNAILRILETTSKSKLNYINAMIFLNMRLDEKIKSELKENADAIADTLKDL